MQILRFASVSLPKSSPRCNYYMYLENQPDAVLSSLCLLYCQVTLHVSGVSRTHHQEYTNCSYNHRYKSMVEQLLHHGLFLNGFYHYILKFMACTSCCNYSLCTPDDGCARHPKHVE
jgi:hypothetical protein